MRQRGVAMHRARHIQDILHVAEIDAPAGHNGDFVSIAQLHLRNHRDTFQGRGLAARSQDFVEAEFNQSLDGLERFHAGIDGAMEGELQPFASLHQGLNRLNVKFSLVVQGPDDHALKTKFLAEHDVGFHHFDFVLVVDVVARSRTDEHPHRDKRNVDGLGQSSKRRRNATHFEALAQLHALGAAIHRVLQRLDAVGTDFQSNHSFKILGQI